MISDKLGGISRWKNEHDSYVVPTMTRSFLFIIFIFGKAYNKCEFEVGSISSNQLWQQNI